MSARVPSIKPLLARGCNLLVFEVSSRRRLQGDEKTFKAVFLMKLCLYVRSATDPPPCTKIKFKTINNNPMVGSIYLSIYECVM